MRKFIIGMILLLGVFFLLSRIVEVRSISQILREGQTYIPMGSVMVITLACRGISFWLPLDFLGNCIAYA